MDKKKIIPLVRLKDGNLGYDCDIFAGDDVNLTNIEEIRISGNLSTGNNFIAFDIYLGENGYFGNNTEFLNIESDGDLYFEDYADVCNVFADGFISFGTHALTGSVNGGKGTFFGPHHSTIY